MKTISPKKLIEIFVRAEKSVTGKKEMLNNLNVYPVPDGDTGVNMSLTLKEVVKSLNEKKLSSVDEIVDVIAQSSLLGGRGNSGVILSQFLAGFCEKLKGHPQINKKALLDAFKLGKEKAYESVSKPVEGTILTIMKSAADEFEKQIEKDNLVKIMQKVVNRSQSALKKTPQMLPKLKEAGVVDAGGAGFLYFIEGFYQAIAEGDKRTITPTDDFASPKTARIWEENFGLFGSGGIRAIIDFNLKAFKYAFQNITWILKNTFKVFHYGISFMSLKKAWRVFKSLFDQVKKQNIESSNVSFFQLLKVWQKKPEEKYCFEAIVDGVSENENSIKKQISKFGTSAIVAKQGKLLKLHFHTNDKEQAEKKAKSFGNIKTMKIDNLHKQHKDFITKDEPEVGAADGTRIIAVVNGRGFEKIYSGFEGVETLEGGKTMNPSVSDLLKAFEKSDSSNLIILPNNKNIFLAANNASLKSEKKIEIVKTKNQAEGLHILLNFNKKNSLDQNFKNLKRALGTIETFLIAKAEKDSNIDNRRLSKGNYFARINSSILSSSKDLKRVLFDGVKQKLNGFELITLYSGRSISQKKAEKLQKALFRKFGVETQLYRGDQAHYEFIVTLE